MKIAEKDMMAEALAKQDQANAESGPSMAELFRQKTEQNEKLLSEKEKGTGKASESDV